MTTVVNPLANPKGLKLLCELCQKPAHVMCEKCRVTYYCSHEHQEIDKVGIHEKICASVKFLKSKFTFLPSEEERTKHKNMILNKKVNHTSHLLGGMMEIMELSRTRGQKLLFEGHHQHAVPAAMQSLKYAIDIYGLVSVELVPSYLILGEASLGIGKLSQAEEYLSQAEWTVLKTTDCPNTIKYKLFRIMGLLYAAKGDFNDSLRCLADDIYHASMEYSPTDIHTSGGYFHMANVFFRLSKLDVAESLYTKITKIWYEYLRTLIKSKTDDPVKGNDIPRREDPPSLESQGLDEAQQAEAKRVLSSILDMRRNVLPNDSELLVVMYSIAMLYCILDLNKEAKEVLSESLKSAREMENVDLKLTDEISFLDDYISKHLLSEA